MNGELHSEHVISRSGIAVVLHESEQRTSHSLLHFGALAWRFFQPQGCGTKALFHKHYAEKLASRSVIGPEFTPANRRTQTFIALKLQKPVARSLHADRRVVALAPHDLCESRGIH